MFLKRLLFSTLLTVLLGCSLAAADAGIDLEELQAAGTESKSFLEILFKSAIDKSTEEAEKLEEKLREAQEIHDIITPEPVNVPEAAALPEQTVETPEEVVEPAEQTVETPEEVVEPAVEKAEQTVELTSAVREVAVFYVEGEGWTLEDYSDAEGSPTSRLKYTGREYLNGKTAFSFYPYSNGEYIITIRKTDYSAGTVDRLKYILTVVATPIEMPVNADLNRDNEPEASDSVNQVETVAELDTETAGRTADIAVNDLIATDVSDVEDLILPDEGSEAVKTAKRFADLNNYTDAIRFLERCLEKHEISERDAVLFKLAGLYETSPELRDERTAVELYRQIVDYYPVSIYWTQAKEKIIYLERTFIYIR